MENIWLYLKLLLAAALIWPRGYLLIYLIDRTKSFSFPFKFFGGWLLGIGTFAVDIFMSNYLGGLNLFWWVYASSLVSQIFGFGFMIFLFERQVPLPHIKNFLPFCRRQYQRLIGLKAEERVVLAVLVLLVLTGLSKCFLATSLVNDSWNQKAALIYRSQTIDFAAPDPGEAGLIGQYPLHDSLFRAYLAAFSGGYSQALVGFTAAWYYLFYVLLFYFCLPLAAARLYRLLATCLIAFLPVFFYNSGLAFEDTLLAVWLLMSISALLKFLENRGLSYFYFAEIALALAVWTKNEALYIAFPFLFFATVILFWRQKIKLKDLILCWFFAGLTVGGWFLYLAAHGSKYFTDLSWQIFTGGLFWPRLLFYLTAPVLALRFSDFLVKLHHEKNRQMHQ